MSCHRRNTKNLRACFDCCDRAPSLRILRYVLDEVLQVACLNGIPILIVLDEFDALLGSSTSLEPSLRQLLMYRLLDRVTTQGTLLCLLAITSPLDAVSMSEKRVKSRAEGTSKAVFLMNLCKRNVWLKYSWARLPMKATLTVVGVH